MTRQNAIKWLKDYRKNTDFEMPQYEEALEMAIKALSQEPCDDAISREAAINKVIDAVDEWDGGCNKSRATLIEKAIRELPSVTHKSGKWIDYRDDGFVECPFCGHATNCEDDIDELHYCFYCGACMKDGRTLDEFIEDSKESEEISERNMKMWEGIFKAERGDKE